MDNPWKVEQRAMLWRVVNGSRVWGANKGCTEREAQVIAYALNKSEEAHRRALVQYRTPSEWDEFRASDQGER